MALISKYMTLTCAGDGKGGAILDTALWDAGSILKYTTYGTRIPDLQEVGDLAAGSATERDKIEVTTLQDDQHKFVQGLRVENSFDSIEFKCLYDAHVYRSIVDLNEEIATGSVGTSTWYVLIPDTEATIRANDSAITGTAHAFKIVGNASVSFDGVGVGAALTMTITITPTEEITTTMADVAIASN